MLKNSSTKSDMWKGKPILPCDLSTPYSAAYFVINGYNYE